jgi:hypothetical protein
MNKSLKATLIATTFSFALCTAVTPSLAAGTSAEEAKQLIAEAKTSVKRAKSVGGLWRDTGKIIKKAEKLLAGGKTDDAAKLAYKAIEQGLLGYDQAVAQTSDNLHI